MKIKIMSHNVWGMYAADVVKKVANRNVVMSKIYHEQLPDVIGTQEFARNVYASGLYEMMSDEYVQIDVSAETAELGVEHCYTPMFYRASTVELVKSGFVLYDRAFNNHDSKTIVWGVFKHKESGEIFTVCNTHYWWKVGPEHDVARVGNSKEVLKLKEVLPAPFFIMGDLNCRIDSEAFKTLLEGGLVDVQTAAKDTCDLCTHHAYPGYDEAKDEFFPAEYPGRPYAASIDHILVNAECADKVETFKVMVDPEALTTSDHCPIFVEYDI